MVRLGADVHARQRPEERPVHDIGERGVDPIPPVVLRRGGAEDRHAAERADDAGVEQLDGGVEEAPGEVGPDDPRLEAADGPPDDQVGATGQRLVGLRGRLERTDDRLVPRLDVGEPGDARHERGVAALVGGDVVESGVGGPHLRGGVRREPAEQVVLACGVLVHGDPGAAGELRDPIEGRSVVARLRERLEGGVEDALLGAEPPGAEHRGIGHGRRRRRPARRHLPHAVTLAEPLHECQRRLGRCQRAARSRRRRRAGA